MDTSGQMSKLVISPTECEKLGLRIGRIDCVHSFSAEYVLECIRDNRLDILRMRIEDPARNIYSVFDQLPYKYYLLNISQVFQSGAGENLDNSESFDGLRFENYVKGQENLMRSIVLESFSTHDGSYYFNPAVAGIYSSKDELDSMAEYMANQFHGEDNNWTKLVFLHDVPVGFVSYTIDGDIARGNMFGVLPGRQKSGIGRKIGIYVLNQLGGKMTVRNNVQVQQAASLNLHYALGMKPAGTVLNFHITNL